VSAGILQDAYLDSVEFVEHRPWMVSTFVPSFGSRDVQWIVKGTGEVVIRYDSVKAQNKSVKVSL
jgi:hypothetical protein